MSFFDRLKKGLIKSQTEVWSKITTLVIGEKISAEKLEEMEGLLYASDIGPTMVEEVVTALKKKPLEEDPKKFLFNLFKSKLDPIQEKISEKIVASPKVIMIVGVNGVGKTTTVGKLAAKFTREGAKVLVGAGDTFRAAASQQLKVWSERAGSLLVEGKEGSDSSGVAFETLKKAQEEKVDFCFLDTAGRLHTKTHLMEELKKNKRVLQKLDPTAPHEVWLVLDAITGQNAFNQALEFHEALGVTGLILTKCDGSAKAGFGLGIATQLKIPLVYIGVGESIEDLDRFNSEEYLKSLLLID
ncbi:MAG: signal recognition particle-docking protein FtsY [Bacteriovoracaceae bacterium]|nr:signal recognition particle-docking protein FtsY [Bacteriovoracaceae bacterium]